MEVQIQGQSQELCTVEPTAPSHTPLARALRGRAHRARHIFNALPRFKRPPSGLRRPQLERHQPLIQGRAQHALQPAERLRPQRQPHRRRPAYLGLSCRGRVVWQRRLPPGRGGRGRRQQRRVLVSRPARRRGQQRAQPEQAGPAAPPRARRLPGRWALSERLWRRPAPCSSRSGLCGRRACGQRMCVRRRRRRCGRAGIGGRRGSRLPGSELDGAAGGRPGGRPPLCLLRGAGRGAGVSARDTAGGSMRAWRGPWPPGRRPHSLTDARAEPGLCCATSASNSSRPPLPPASRPSMQRAGRLRQRCLAVALDWSPRTTEASTPCQQQRSAQQSRGARSKAGTHRVGHERRAAVRAGAVLAEPGVDALQVEVVPAARQPPQQLARVVLAQAHAARVLAAAPGRPAARTALTGSAQTKTVHASTRRGPASLQQSSTTHAADALQALSACPKVPPLTCVMERVRSTREL